MKGIRLKLLMLLMVVAASALAVFAGCKIGEPTKEEFLNSKDAAGQCVTYNANGGVFGGTRSVMDLYFKADSYIISNADSFKITRTHYTFGAWYYAQLDNGQPVVDDEGHYVLTDVQVMPEDKIEANTHLYVGAKWVADLAIDIVLVTDDGNGISGSDGDFADGDVIKSQNFSSGDYALTERADIVKATEATFLWFFEDEQCTTPISKVPKPDDSTEENVKVYAKYLRGSWTIVRDAAGVSNMFTYSYREGNYYLFTNDGSDVIDCSSKAVSLSYLDNKIRIEGNGVTLENITVNQSNLQATTYDYSLFGSFTSDSVVRNLTLKNVSINVSYRSGNTNLYLVCSGASDDATIENVKIENASMVFSTSGTALVANIQKYGQEGYITENWLFGGYGTDDGFKSNFSGITVTDASLKYGETEIVNNISK